MKIHYLREAQGTKFLYIVDSYMYAVALSGGADDVINADKGTVWLIRGDLGELIGACARDQGVKESQLGLTAEEIEFLKENTGAVLRENERGYVEAEYFQDQYDATAHFEEYYDVDNVLVQGHQPVLGIVHEEDA